MNHKSDSTEHQKAEVVILEALSKSIGVELKSETIRLSSDGTVQIDGFNEKDKVLCEIYAHIGKLKGSQPDKVASDFLKMLLVEASLGGNWQKYFCFADDKAASLLKGKSWLAISAKKFGIKVCVFPLPKDTENIVKDAQKRQVMINK